MRAVWAGIAVVLAAGVATLLLAGRLLVVSDPLPPRADAIVVLAGSIPDRVLEAADLYRTGIAPRIIADCKSRLEAIVTFLAVLDLLKTEDLRAEQSSSFGEIVLRLPTAEAIATA